ncbi:MAG: type 2 isopentenyl-diphosphate Delta-isomerase [Candidatus Micrarchaeota archaeon]
MAKIDERKDTHIKICEEGEVQYKHPAGFEDVHFVHNALPELDLEKVKCLTEFLGRKLNAPIIISGMTGGTEKGLEINKKLAEGAQEKKVALGLGSGRPMLEDEGKAQYYMVRDVAPDVPIIANIGAVQLKEYDVGKIEGMVQKIEADGLAVHLNALQEAIQPEGETNFENVYENIRKLCEGLDVPVIAKETGAGINSNIAKKLFDGGVKWVEVSGKGGTSWSKVEYARGGRLQGFEEWGYPTIPAVAECAAFGNTICSGGVRNGIDAAKAIAIGAKISGAAMPFLKAENVGEEVENWVSQIKTSMFLCGAKNLDELGEAPVLITGGSAEIMKLRGIDPSIYARRGGKGSSGKPSHYI